MKGVPIPQPPSPPILGSNQPLRQGPAADLRVKEAEQRATSDDLSVRIVDEVAATAELRGAEALGAGPHGQDGGALRVLRGGEEEGGEDCGLAPLRLPFLGQGAVVPERRRGRGLRPGGGSDGALMWRCRGGGQHRRRLRIVVSRGVVERGELICKTSW